LKKVVPIIVDKASTTFLLAADPETPESGEVADTNAEPSHFYRWDAINDALERIESPRSLVEILRIFSTVGTDGFPPEWKMVNVEEVRQVDFK
jgi:hypothetical protein